MHIASVRISNFRLFKEFSVALNPGLNLIVGENNGGKTSFIDAIRLCLGTNSKERSFLNESDFHEGENSLSIQIKFSAVEKHAFRFVEHLSFENYTGEDGEERMRPALFIQLSAKKTGTERRGYPYIQTEIRSGVEGDGALIESEIRDFLAATYLKPLRDAQAELSTGRASRLSQILNSSKDIRQSATDILTIIAQANTALLAEDSSLQRSAIDIRDNYLHKLIFEAEKDNLGTFIDIAGVKEERIGDLNETEKRRYLRAVLESLSLALSEDGHLHGLGYHNLLFMAAELLLLEQESGNEFPLLLVEEPEAHLHPQLQMKLLQFIESKVSADNSEAGIQCVLSTHSPNLASKADPRAIISFGQGKAWSMREDETELDPEDYVFVQKFLDVTKAGLFFARGLLLVEGDAENILLPTLAKLLNHNLEDHGVSIIKYDNSGSWKRFARLFLRSGLDDQAELWNPTKVSVLRDLDLWPDCAEESQQNQYGFKTRKPRNQFYWRQNCDDVDDRKANIAAGLNRQNVSVFVSDDWTFEYCLAKFGLFPECFEALFDRRPTQLETPADDDEKGTYILSKASKTDFAYKLASLLESQRAAQQEAAVHALGENPDNTTRTDAVAHANRAFAVQLAGKLPPYILQAIKFAIGAEAPQPAPAPNQVGQ
jgi:putative ATP-dependent endonuclease of OLD family